jgi:hypothetical protein
VKSNISEQTNYLQIKFTILHPQNYKMPPLLGVTLAGLAKKYPKNGGVRKANWLLLLSINICLQTKFKH